MGLGTGDWYLQLNPFYPPLIPILRLRPRMTTQGHAMTLLMGSVFYKAVEAKGKDCERFLSILSQSF